MQDSGGSLRALEKAEFYADFKTVAMVLQKC
jgi:hypothetical protein